MRKTLVWSLVLGAASALTTARAHAQSGEPAMMSGVVRDTLGNPLSGAEIVVVGVGLSARSSTDGVYAIFGVPPGIRRVVVRRVGFQQVVHDLGVEPGADVRVDVDLTPSVPRLAEVVVEGAAPIRVTTLSAFEHRRKTANGMFLTEEQITRRNPLRATDLVRGMPGVQVRNAPRGIGFVIFMGSGGAQCKPALYLDGIPTTESTLDNLPRDGVVAVEVYRKTVDAPPPYMATSCGVIGYWSRTGPPAP